MADNLRAKRGAWPGAAIEPDAASRAALLTSPIRYGWMGAEASAGGGAFPSVTLLDDFNRADAASLGANWDVDPLGFGDLSAIIASNAAAVPSGTDYGCGAWNVADFGPDVAVCTTIGAAAGGATWGVTLYARVVDANNYYYFGTGAAGNAFLGNGTGGSIAPDITLSAPPSVGDRIGLVCRGTTIEGWVYQSGAWSKVIFATDALTSAAGQAMFEISDDGGALAIDDFSAVTL